MLILRASEGLKIGFPDQQNWENEIEINMSSHQEHLQNNYSIQLKVRSEFPSQTDGSVIDHKVVFFLSFSTFDNNIYVIFM